MWNTPNHVEGWLAASKLPTYTPQIQQSTKMQPPLASVGRYRKGSQELNLSIFKIKVNQNSARLDQIRTSRPLLSELVAWPTAVVFTFLHFQTVRPFLKMKSHVDCHSTRAFKLEIFTLYLELWETGQEPTWSPALFSSSVEAPPEPPEGLWTFFCYVWVDSAIILTEHILQVKTNFSLTELIYYPNDWRI